jgi:hypothetical protein
MNTLPFDILNKVLIYYMEPLDRANLGVVNKFNNSNRIEWKKKFRISEPDKMVFYRLKFKRHCSNMEVFIPEKYKSKTEKEFNNLPMVKLLNQEPYLIVKKNTFYVLLITQFIILSYCYFLNFSLKNLAGMQIGFIIFYLFLKELAKPCPPITKEVLIHAYIARDYYCCKNKNYWDLINKQLNKGGWFQNMVSREIPNFEEKYEKIKRSKDLYKFYDLFTKNQLELLGW